MDHSLDPKVAASAEIMVPPAVPDDKYPATFLESKGIKGVWVEPTPDLVIGEIALMAHLANVEAVRIPGYWMDKKGSDTPIGQAPAAGEKVLYCLHGGAYIAFSAYPKDITANIARAMLEHTDSVKRTFSVEYRLSKAAPYEPANPFPAALIDALAGYNYLVNTVGFKPEDIIIEGDSAGGNLALALTRYLVEYRSSSINLPAPPSGVVLMSPWADPGDSHKGPGSTFVEHERSDYLFADTKSIKPSYAVRAFTGPHGVGAAYFNRYISPGGVKVHSSFVAFPPTLIVGAGAEMLLDSILTLKRRMEKDLGEKVVYYEAPDAVHDHTVFDFQEPEKTRTLQLVGKWVAHL